MRFAEVANGVVQNVIEVGADAVPEWVAGWPEIGEAGGVGWLYDGVTFTAPVEVVPDPLPVTAMDVNAERDRRLTACFAFQGEIFDRNAQSLARITGAATLAGFAVMAGAQAGDLLWHGGATPFSWITATNTVVQMDAQTAFAFGKAAAAVETRLIFKAYALKLMSPIPEDYQNESYWS